jgi:hypothetical protein
MYVCYCISFKFGSFIFINLCASKGNREKSEDLITITHGVKDYGVKKN